MILTFVEHAWKDVIIVIIFFKNLVCMSRGFCCFFATDLLWCQCFMFPKIRRSSLQNVVVHFPTFHFFMQCNIFSPNMIVHAVQHDVCYDQKLILYSAPCRKVCLRPKGRATLLLIFWREATKLNQQMARSFPKYDPAFLPCDLAFPGTYGPGF